MPHLRQQVGNRGEVVAAKFFETRGGQLVARNWHAGRYGELDLVFEEQGELVVVEVKTRVGSGFGRPEEAVNQAKQAKLKLAAQAFLLAHPHLPQRVRFDVVAVVLSPAGDLVDFKHFERLVL